MFEASLYLDKDTFIKKISMENFHHQIRVLSQSYKPIPTMWIEGAEPSDIQITHNVFVYEFMGEYNRDNYNREYRYVFSHMESIQELPKDDTDSFDIGFEEPTKEVNLDKLKKKLKGGGKTRQILEKFFNRR